MAGPVRACPVCPGCGSKRFARMHGSQGGGSGSGGDGGGNHGSSDDNNNDSTPRNGSSTVTVRCRSCGRIIDI